MAKLLHRELTLERGLEANADTRTITLAFASETPVIRRDWETGGTFEEILSCTAADVDLSRLNNAHPLLLNHDPERQIGVIESATVDADKMCRAKVRFGKSELANEIWQDVKDGIRRLVSVGYSTGKEIQREQKAGRDVRTFAWVPYEVSIVPIPADVKAGVGRDATETETPKGNLTMDSQTQTAAPTVNVEAVRTEALNAERSRINEINAFAKLAEGKVNNVRELADKAIAEGQTVNDLRKSAWENLKGVEKIANPNPMLGMTERDMSKYSLIRAIQCSVTGKFDGLEGEMHAEAMKQRGVSTRGANSVIIPFDVLAYSKRDALATTGTLGGNLVATNLLSGSFIDALVNKMKVAQLGATFLPGLVGNVAIPRQTAGASVYWAASEAAATTESNITFDQVTMTPKQITARVDYSWQSLLQTTPGIEQIIRNDLNTRLALGIDLAAIHGSGSSGQPTGIIATSGIGSVTVGANGGAPTWAAVVGLETALANSNADDNTLAYLTNSRVRGKCKQVLKNASGTDASWIWQDGNQPGYGMVNGYKAAVSNQVSNTLTTGTSTTVCSAMIFADWSQLLIGSWGGLEILTNQYSQAANRVVEVYAYQACDIAVRHAESFAACTGLLTT